MSILNNEYFDKRTKIVCTLGPASESKEKIEELARVGMNIVRLNFSHGTHEELLNNCSLYKEISDSQMGGALLE